MSGRFVLGPERIGSLPSYRPSFHASGRKAGCGGERLLLLGLLTAFAARRQTNNFLSCFMFQKVEDVSNDNKETTMGVEDAAGTTIVDEEEEEEEEEDEEENNGEKVSKFKIAMSINHEDSVGMSVCKVHISATRWRIYT
jgi:hypothetical protein